MKKKLFHLIFLCCGSTVIAQAQTFEIRAVNKGNGFVSVELRNTSGTAPTTANYITDLVFGIKWLNSYDVELVSTIATNYAIVKSDTRKEKNGYYYQAFSAANTPFYVPSAWTQNVWIEIMSIRNTMTGRGTGTFAITEPGFDITTDPNFGIDLVDFTPVVTASAENVLLPVRWLNFSATPVNSIVLLNWVTENEQNNKGFAIERSDGDATNFKTVGWADGKGGSSFTNEYELVDKDVVTGVKYHYRLKQIDIDDKYRYSDVRTVMLEKSISRAIRISPNPASRELDVFFGNSVERGAVLLKVVDVKGAVVISKNHLMDRNGNAHLNVSGVANGHYLLVVERNREILYSEAFQKQ